MGGAIRYGLLGAAAAVALAVPAYGQGSFDRDRNVSVTERPKPEYDPIGMPLGAFRLFPEAELGVEYNDNIYAAPTGDFDDAVGTANLSAALVSGWSRHALNLNAFVNHSEYFDFSDETHTDWGASANGRIDVSRQTQIEGVAEYGDLTEQRGAAGSTFASVEPTQYERARVAGEIVHTLNRVQVSGRANWTDLDYQDGISRTGLTIQQDHRDRVVTRFGGRLAYAVSPDTAVFVDGVVNNREYDLQPPAAALNRDSDGYRVLVGADFDITDLVRGEIGVGYMDQNYDDPTLTDIDGFAVNGEVEWFPTPLTTVTLRGSRTIEESAVGGSGGFVSTSFGARVDHELRRNLLLGGEVSYGNDDYKGLDREDERLRGQVDITYLMNRYAGLRFFYMMREQDSSGAVPGPEYTVGRTGVSVILKR